MSFQIEDIQKAILQENLDGWLFSNFRYRDSLSNKILGLPRDLSMTRTWFYAVPASGSPLKIVQAVEDTNLDSLPGDKVTYLGRENLFAALKPLAGKSWGAHISDTLPAISYMDAGTAATLQAAGLKLVSAAALIQRFKGLLDEEGVASHNRAANAVYDIMGETWELVAQSYRAGRPLYEGTLKTAMLDGMKKRGVITHLPPLVAAGRNSSNPHYIFSGDGSLIGEGDVIQLDLWAKEEMAGSIYADISWVGVYRHTAEPEIAKAFSELVGVREETLNFIEDELKAGRRPSGAQVDTRTVSALRSLGYADAIRHRTGHGIDVDCHGSGVNIDSVEFPDERLLIDGSCFSIEPGIYLDNFGLRTEINVYISGGKAFVSGKGRQFSLLNC